VEETPTHWTFRATFIDLERGFTDFRLFRQRKAERHGKFDDERALDIAFQIGQSKAKRNVIVRALPVWLVDRATKASTTSAEAGIKDLPAEIASAIPNWQKKWNVNERMLAAKIGVPKEAWTARDMVRLRATWKALLDRTTTVEQEFAPTNAPAAEVPAAVSAAAAVPDAGDVAPSDNADEGP
jgi:hypothetical protein